MTLKLDEVEKENQEGKRTEWIEAGKIFVFCSRQRCFCFSGFLFSLPFVYFLVPPSREFNLPSQFQCVVIFYLNKFVSKSKQKCRTRLTRVFQNFKIFILLLSKLKSNSSQFKIAKFFITKSVQSNHWMIQWFHNVLNIILIGSRNRTIFYCLRNTLYHCHKLKISIFKLT